MDHILVAAISHETNTFSPVPTPIESFGPAGGPLFGDHALETFRDTETAAGGLIDIATSTGAHVSVPIVARSMPSAPVDDAAYDAITNHLCDALRKAMAAGRCDALFLALHGAMVTHSLDDGEGALLTRLRRIAPRLPIALSLDFHANVTSAMVTAPTSIVAFKTFPHLDMRESARHAARIVVDAVRGAVVPVTEWGNLPLLVHLQCMDTNRAPWKDLMDLAREAESRPGVLAVSVLGGFPLADTHEAGLSCIVTTDGDRALARSIRDTILGAAWQRREGFHMQPEPLAVSVRRARERADGHRPMLLLDVADTCNSGGALDGVSVLREVMRQGLENVASAPLCDPQAVRQMCAAGIGNTIEICLGDKTATPAIDTLQQPLRLRGRVSAVHDGPLTVTGPVFTGTLLDLGPSVAFNTGPLEIVVTSRRAEPYDPGIFRCVGIEPRNKRFVVLKSRMQCKPAFLPFSAGYVDCNGCGVTTSDLTQFHYQRLRRPIYPLDVDVRWKP